MMQLIKQRLNCFFFFSLEKNVVKNKTEVFIEKIDVKFQNEVIKCSFVAMTLIHFKSSGFLAPQKYSPVMISSYTQRKIHFDYQSVDKPFLFST